VQRTVAPVGFRLRPLAGLLLGWGVIGSTKWLQLPELFRVLTLRDGVRAGDFTALDDLHRAAT
jgi:hypothetical protein